MKSPTSWAAKCSLVSRKADSLLRKGRLGSFHQAAVFQEEMMHVHANYSLQLASLGASRDEIKEIADRRSTVVRRKPSVASATLSEVEDSVFAVAPQSEEHQDKNDYQDPNSNEFGRLLSVRA